LYEQISNRFAADIQRRRPPLLLVLSHIDLLRPLRRDPTDDGDDGDGEARRARTIELATASVIAQIGLDSNTPAIPACLSPAAGLLNVDTILTQILKLVDTATQAQLNRRRVERSHEPISWRTRITQFRGMGALLGRGLRRR
jgi:hypothetical protein